MNNSYRLLGSSVRDVVEGNGIALAYGHPHVVGHDQHASEEDCAADHPYDVTVVAGLNCLDKAVGQRAVGIDRAPHQALHDAVNPHGGDVEHGADGRQPEVGVDQGGAVHFLESEQAWNQVVDSTDGDHGNPAQRTGVYVTNGPVGVVGQGVNRLDGHHRAFKGGHTVERQGDHQEAQDRIGPQLVPSARQRHHAVDHATPGGCQQNQGHNHTGGLCPVGQGAVVQVVRTGPDVDGNQCPEVNDGQAIGVNRTLSLLRHEVVHDAEEARGQEETDGIVAVPPLHHGVDGTGIDRVGLHPTDGNRQAVTDVQECDLDDECTKEPVCNVDVLGLALGNSTEENDGVGNPDGGDQDVNRPLQFRIFLGGRVTHRQGDDGGNDNCLPAPESKRSQPVREQASLRRPLHYVVGRCEQGATAECKDHRIGVQGPDAAEAKPCRIEVQLGPNQLSCDQYAHRHTDDAPNNCHDGELAHHLVVVRCVIGYIAHEKYRVLM